MNKHRRRIILQSNRIVLPPLDPKTVATASDYFEKRYLKSIELSFDEYSDICAGMNWKFPDEKVRHITELNCKPGALYEYEDTFLERWGRTKENLAIFRYHTDHYADEFESYDIMYYRELNGRGFDDGDIIRKIQDGDGDMYGY